MLATEALSSNPSKRIRDWAVATFAKLNSRLALVPVVLLYFWLTNYIFVQVIGKNTGFRLAGFEYYTPLPFTQLLAAFVAIAPLVWLQCNFRRVSDILVLHIYVFVFVPTAVYIPIAIPATFDRQLALHALMILAMGLVDIRRYIRPVHILRLPTTHALYSQMLVALASLAIVYMAWRGEITWANLDLSTVYERRAAIIAEEGGTLLVYVANWSAFAIAPVCLAYGYVRRNWLLVLLGLALAVEGFAVTSFRSLLFLPIFSFGVMLLFRFLGPRALTASMLTVGILLTVIPLSIDSIFSLDSLVSWLVEFRFIGNNGFLSAQYFSFFEFAPRGHYYDSFGRFFVQAVYNRPIAELVGSSFSIEGNHANGNLWADGYGNLGVTGVLFASLSLALLSWILDSISQGRNIALGIVAAITFGFGISNSAVHAVLTSNGGILLLLLLFALPSREPTEA